MSTVVKRTPWQIQRAVVFALFIRELKTRFGGQWIGAIWALFEPISQVCMMLFIRGFIKRGGEADFFLFMLTGVMPFTLFKDMSFRLMDAVNANQGLFAYRPVKPMDAIISRTLLEILTFIIVYIVILSIMGWAGLDITPVRPLELLTTTLILVLSGMGLGLYFLVLTDDRPKVKTFIRLAFAPLYILSGVLIPIESFPAQWQEYLYWNPLAHFIALSRAYYIPGTVLPGNVSFTYTVQFAVIMMALGLSMYRVNRNKLTDR